jgi:sortase A
MHGEALVESGRLAAVAPAWTARALRRTLRFLADVAMVGGVLLLIEAGVTVLWQEPLTSFLAARAQAGLDDDLAALEDQALAEGTAAGPPSRQELAAYLARRQDRRTEVGEAIGRIDLPTLDRDYAMVEGTGEGPLRKGPGHYVETPLPGQHGTFGVAGHRTTYLAPFRYVDQLEAGEPIIAEMPYGTFTYRVEKTLIVEPEEVWVKNPVSHDRIVLTACHPPFSAEERIVVFGELDRFRLNGYDAGPSRRGV